MIVREVVVSLPLPDRALNPHAKGTFWPKAKATKQAKSDAMLSAMSMKPYGFRGFKRAIVEMDYDTSPSKADSGYRPMDVQNAVAAVKAYIDGCVQAGIVPDDDYKHLSWGSVRITRTGRPGVTLTFRGE